MYPDKLKKLIDSFSQLPGIGNKSAERLAMHVLTKFDENTINEFAKNLSDINNLGFCKRCHNVVSEDELCSICTNENRNKETILVVENIKDVFILEKINNYDGQYHVLGGAINFAAGIGIDELNINSLLQRVKTENIKEVILATNATVEGETTAKYIKALLESQNVLVTRIAYGIPVGGDISYADEVTLQRALEGRRNF